MTPEEKQAKLQKFLDGIRWTVSSPGGRWVDLSMEEAYRRSFQERMVWGEVQIEQCVLQ